MTNTHEREAIRK